MNKIIYINLIFRVAWENHALEGIPPEVWAFTIGDYQVCHKWLEDHKGWTLTFAYLHHYQKIIVVLAHAPKAHPFPMQI